MTFSAPQLISRMVEVGADRLALLSEALGGAGVGFEMIRVGDTRHLYVPPARRLMPGRKVKTLVAHHDRHPDSPGANDNGAAVARLADFATSPTFRKAQNLQILFTDREEVRTGDPLRDQGAWRLAQYLKGQGESQKWVFFSLDVFGRGDTVVLSTTSGLLLKKRPQFEGRTGAWTRLYQGVYRRLSVTTGAFNLATPLSDEFSFNAHGFPAVLITALPTGEALDWKRRRRYPLTWRQINTKEDTLDTLSPGSEGLMRRVMESIGGLELHERDYPTAA